MVMRQLIKDGKADLRRPSRPRCRQVRDEPGSLEITPSGDELQVVQPWQRPCPGDPGSRFGHRRTQLRQRPLPELPDEHPRFPSSRHNRRWQRRPSGISWNVDNARYERSTVLTNGCSGPASCSHLNGLAGRWVSRAVRSGSQTASRIEGSASGKRMIVARGASPINPRRKASVRTGLTDPNARRGGT